MFLQIDFKIKSRRFTCCADLQGLIGVKQTFDSFGKKIFHNKMATKRKADELHQRRVLVAGGAGFIGNFFRRDI